jgi:hypothetical protein
MAKNVSSKFNLDSGLFEEKANTQASAEVQKRNTAPDNLSSLFSPSDTVATRPLGCTQGRKGQKAKRINMAFADEIHAYITYESRRRGMNATQFVNMVLEKYMNSPEGRVD